MAKGYVKQKEYDWKDSNLALFGSDVEKNVKRESARAEEAWEGAGRRVCLQVWIIKEFKVVKVPRHNGEFCNGDSYIILNTYKDPEEDELKYDVHFWIGKNSTPDEYGTAAYKTVELDTYLDDKAVQHREVMGHESDLFKSYFPRMTVLEGGHKSGFHAVLPETHERHLLRVRGTTVKNCTVDEVDMSIQSLNNDDVFILDLGMSIYQWNGVNCDKDERFKAMLYCQELKRDRNGRAKVDVYEQEDMDGDHPFYKMLGNKDVQQEEQGDYCKFQKTLLRYSIGPHGQNSQLKEISRGRISFKSLDENDVFLVDTGNDLFIWVGGRASVDEKRRSFEIGHFYLMQTDHPYAAISVFTQGKEPQEFIACFDQ